MGTEQKLRNPDIWLSRSGSKITGSYSSHDVTNSVISPLPSEFPFL